MHKIVIADTSFLIAIHKLNLFNGLHDLYKEIYVTQTISQEFQFPLPDWIIIQEPTNLHILSVLSLVVDQGEASAIALAYDYMDVTLIIDDLKARKEAIRLGFKITGTLGVLYKLKQAGIIASLKEKIFQLNEAGFRISPVIVQQILRKADENEF